MITKTVNDFENYVQQLGYSKNTLSMLTRLLQEFLEYLPVNPFSFEASKSSSNKMLQESFMQEQVESFYNWLQIRPHKQKKEGGLSEIYISHHIYTLRVFFNYLEATGRIEYNPISMMKFKRPKYNRREPLTKEDIHQLFETASTPKETAMLHLFYSCGLRRSEAVELNIRDVHFKSCLLYVRNGKGHKRRAIPMTEKVSEDLENYYLQERSDSHRKAKDTEAFILNHNGQRLSGDSYNKKIKVIVEKSAIEKLCTLHHLRHSIATHLLENGLSLENVRDFLGHSYLEATQIYTKINSNQLSKL